MRIIEAARLPLPMTSVGNLDDEGEVVHDDADDDADASDDGDDGEDEE